MYYSQMRKFDIANGEGIRATLFVSGCTRNCNGCFNKEYQNFDNGYLWDTDAENKFMKYISDENVHGVTLLGGEPMDQINDECLINLVDRIKRETTHTIWVYSGYVYEDIVTHPVRRKILEKCDVLVDGPFIEEEKDLSLRFRGSRNQRIIDVGLSLESDHVVLYDL